MKKISVKRVVLDGTATKVEFPTICRKWLVKNFTEGDIYVSFDETLNTDEAIKITSNCWQQINTNENYAWNNECKSTCIHIQGTGEVEIQQLCFE